MTTNGKRHTNAKNDLIDQIINMRIKEGKTRQDIFQFLRDLEYAPSTCYEYMQKAKDESDMRSVQNFGEDLKEDIERFEALYASCLKEGNKREARENLKEIAKLKGHYCERIAISGELVIKTKWGDE